MFKRLSLLLLAMLVIPALSDKFAPEDEELKCTHDDIEHPEPEFADIEEDYNPEGNDHEGRTLASYSNLRTYGYYGLLNSAPSSYKSYMQRELIPPILDFYRAALKVKYPSTSAIRTSSSRICGITTPSVLKSGVANTDYVLMVDHAYDSSKAWVAECVVCLQATGTNRPIVAKAKVNRWKLKATNDVLLHEKNMLCIMHEITHSLGLTNTLFKYFLSSTTGKRLTGHITTGSLNGATQTVLAIEPVRSKLRNHYGCSSLRGLYIENGGGAGTAGSHPERRHFGFDFMTSGLVYQMQVTDMTLSFLESTGWYVPNYSYGEKFAWGKNQGCQFLTGSCAASSFDYNNFCSGSTRGCAHPGRGGGVCTTDRLTGSCRFVHPNVNYDCDNSNADNYARLPSAETYGRGKNSKCFVGTLSSTSSSAASTSFCFKYTCSGSQLTVHVGSKSAVCTREGKISVPGYKGTINCPNPASWCATVGTKNCLRGCMGRGTCNNGKCQCRSGYKGIDCGLSSSF